MPNGTCVSGSDIRDRFVDIMNNGWIFTCISLSSKDGGELASKYRSSVEN